MKISNVLITLAVVFLVIKIPSCISQKGQVAKHMDEFIARINDDISQQACVKEGPFPFSSRYGRQSGNSRHVSYTCEKCDILFQAGLLDKEVIEYTPAPGARDNQKAGFETRYELTELGNSVYDPGSSDDLYSKDAPRFCLGKARVKQITRTTGPVMLGGVKNIGIRYVAMLDNPHPFLHDPRAKLLGIPLPAGDPPLYPEANVTAVFDERKVFYLDSSLQLGF